jgi:hypothetical protein
LTHVVLHNPLSSFIFTEKLASSGISKSKIIVGLTAWARSYIFDDRTQGEHGAYVLSTGEGGNETKRRDGRLAYYEVNILEYTKQL